MISLVPKLHLGTQLSAQLRCPVARSATATQMKTLSPRSQTPFGNAIVCATPLPRRTECDGYPNEDAFPSFPNSIWERDCPRNSVAPSHGVRRLPK